MSTDKPEITTILRANGHLVRECWDAAAEIERLRDQADHFRVQLMDAKAEIVRLHQQIRDLQSSNRGLNYIVEHINYDRFK